MKRIIYVFLLLPQITFSNEQSHLKKDSVYFFTSNLVFVPTQSSVFEARTGVTRFTNKNLKLDIGVSFDIAGYKTKSTTYAAGADFFTFSSLRSEGNFKFPVDAIDYFFGINFTLKKLIQNKITISHRLRISHISSHFEDGHIYERTDTIFTPVVYSKEFLDFAAAADFDFLKRLHVKSLLAVNYIFHSIPKDLSKFSGQLGIELKYYLSSILSVYVSNDITLASAKSQTNMNENLETGITVGRINSRALNLYFTYYDGQDYRGQYYGRYLNYKGIGFKLKF